MNIHAFRYLIALLLVCSPVLADPSFHYVVKDGRIGLRATANISTSGDAAVVKMEWRIQDKEGNSKRKDLWYDRKMDELWLIDHEARTNFRIPSPIRNKPLMSSAEEAKMLQSLPLEQRQAYEEMKRQAQQQPIDYAKERKRRSRRLQRKKQRELKSSLKSKSTVANESQGAEAPAIAADSLVGRTVSTGESTHVGNYDCQTYIDGDRRVSVADPAKLTSFESQLRQLMLDLASFYHDMGDKLADMPELGSVVPDSKLLALAFLEFDGLVVGDKGPNVDISLDGTGQSEAPDTFQPNPDYATTTVE